MVALPPEGVHRGADRPDLARVFTLAPGAPTLVGATNTAAFDIGNTLAPALGGATIAAGWGCPSVAWVGAALALLGLAGALWAGALERRDRRTGIPAVPTASRRRASRRTAEHADA
ncbi:hypothetical protein [Streptomyces uncialis]|uniref:hypothetical protein n=1 Tax=Streptomyces uncialis TaxID=1048205 RepID=UPI0033CE598A